MILLSIVIPCRNEEANIVSCIDAIAASVGSLRSAYGQISSEIIFVDDGSTDGTLAAIQKAVESASITIKYLSFSRNFGKEAAIYAGLEKAQGNYVAIIDADLQDPPSLLGNMLEAVYVDEYDMAIARRRSRDGEPVMRAFFSRLFYKVFRVLTYIEVKDGERDFRLMTRRVVDAVLALSERNRFSKGIFGWLGFKTAYFEYDNQVRVAGNSQWSFGGLCHYAIEGITSFSSRPLLLASMVGIGFCFIALLFLVFIVLRAFFVGDPVAGWPSMISVILLLGGLQLFFLGIMGQYVAKTYIETKNRPLYIVRETNYD